MIKEFYDNMGANQEGSNIVNLAFTGMIKGGYSYAFQTLDSMSNTDYLGFAASRLDRTAFVIPLEKVTSMSSDMTKKTTFENVTLVHPALDGYNRGLRKITSDGMQGNPPNGDVDTKIQYCIQSLGLQVMGAAKMGLLQPNA
jgi:hypothetical protein